MQHEGDADAGVAADGRIGNVALDETVPAPGLLSNALRDLVQVGAVTGSEIIEADDPLTQP
jgi:hypothetical protein